MKSPRHLTASLLTVAVAATLGAVAPDAGATPLGNGFASQPFIDTLLPGTSQAARPELTGTVLADVLTPFSLGALNISGSVQNRVVREEGTGTLDFYWRVQVDPASTGGGISAFRIVDFGYASLTDADWRTDGVGTVAPTTGRLFNPVNDPSGAINFLFDPAVGAGASSFLFFLHTDARNYSETASYDLLGGPSQTLTQAFSTFAPAAAVPEPSPAATLALGVLLLGWLRHRRSAARIRS